ncbi:MAG: TetR/AcrR family transcriptional regulator [Pseudomonadales bacterium]|nr:TetR/AcrR family transcriptional regulator [Pseudomonadales bacterium]
MEQDTTVEEVVSPVQTLLKATQKELGQVRSELNFSFPWQGAKSDVLFNSIGVFTSKGIEDTTVQDLLDAANISRRTFYKYFKNKVDVLESIYQVAAEILLMRFKAANNQAQSIREFMVQCVELYFDYHTHLGPLVRMMTEEARRADSPLASHRETLLKHIVDLFEEKYFEFEGVHLDPKVYYSLIWMMESATMNILSNMPTDQAVVEEFKAVMCAISARVVATDPAQWAELPAMPAKQ